MSVKDDEPGIYYLVCWAIILFCIATGGCVAGCAVRAGWEMGAGP